MKRWIVLLPFALLLFQACTQEHFIFVRNIRTAKLLTMDQVLGDAGLLFNSQASSTTSTTLPRLTTTTTIPYSTTTTTVPTVTKYLDIPAGEEFSINIYEPNMFIILKKITGNLTLLSNRSDPENGFFLFRNGVVNSQATFYIHELGGRLRKIIVYKIDIPATAGRTNTQVVTQSPTNLRTLIPPDTTQTQQNVLPTGIANTVIASLRGLSESEQIRTLSNNIASVNVPQGDKEILRYKLLDILIAQRSFSLADPQIAALQDRFQKALYQGRYYWKKSQYVNAIKAYLEALDGPDATKRAAIVELSKLLYEYGNVETNIVMKLRTETEKYKDSDPEFYGRTILDVGRLYEFVRDVYEAERVYQSVLNGNYSAETKRVADAYYTELKNNFLLYR